ERFERADSRTVARRDEAASGRRRDAQVREGSGPRRVGVAARTAPGMEARDDHVARRQQELVERLREIRDEDRPVRGDGREEGRLARVELPAPHAAAGHRPAARQRTAERSERPARAVERHDARHTGRGTRQDEEQCEEDAQTRRVASLARRDARLHGGRPTRRDPQNPGEPPATARSLPPPGGASASGSGSLTTKLVPPPGTLSTAIVPPCRPTAFAVIASPRPDPGIFPTFPPRWNGSKSVARSSAGMPIPWSVTRKVTARSCRDESSCTVPPPGEY